ncbi:retrovirus-related pol polyprotein from transposon TNT 1-94, partial [Tanacetum coccineum]
MIEKGVYDKLVKSYSTLEKHCISLELATQLNQEIFQKDNSGENQNAPTFNQLFEINKLKAQPQEKETVIRKLKDKVKSLSGKESVEKVTKDIDEIETINIEMENSVAKLLSENENLRKEQEHLKSILKDQFDSIKKTCVRSKEHSDSLIAQINAMCVENLDLNAQLQEKVFAVAALKNELRKLKGKSVVDTAVSTPIAITIAPEMFKLNIEPISHRLKNNRDAHEDYLKKTIENNDTLRGLVERARKQDPGKPLLDSACRYTKHVQELLVYVSKTCPSSPKPSEKLVAVTPLNKDKKVRFADPLTSSSNTQKPIDSNITKDSNKPLLHSTRVKCSTGASGSKASGNTMNNRISQSSSSNKTNKVEDQSRSVKSRKNKKNRVDKTECNTHIMQSMLNANSVSKPISNALVKHSMRNAKFESICAICNKCLFDANHDMCLIDYVNDVNECSKSKSKRNKKRKAWKPTIPAVNAPEPDISTGIPSSTTIDQDAPLTSTSQTTPKTPSLVIPLGVEEADHDIKVSHMDDNSSFDIPIPEPISTRHQLQDEALLCYYDSFLSSVEPKSYKDVLTKSCWIEAMQEELNEFERLKFSELVPRPDRVMIITLKWIYKVELDELGGVLKNKTRLVAKRYRQEEGIDFEKSLLQLLDL